MFRNYLIVAVRNLIGHKAYSGINISGLAIGMACCVLILLYIQDELSYDRNHEYVDRICRVVREIRMGSGNTTFKTGSSGALGQALVADFPEVQKAVRVLNFGGRWVRYGENEIQQAVCLADREILDVFTFPLVRGDRETVLSLPSSAVITEEMAAKVFGDEDPIGKVLTVQDRYLGGDYKVTGILKDIPEKTTFRFDLLTSTVSPYFCARGVGGLAGQDGLVADPDLYPAG